MELQLPDDHRFQILRRLGAGGMGVVYEVEDRLHARRCALKTLRAEDGQALYRLKSEFRQLQDLVHPNLVRFEELTEEGGTWLLAMELVDGVGFLEAARRSTADARARRASMRPADDLELAHLASSDDLTMAHRLSDDSPDVAFVAAPTVTERPVCPSDPSRLRALLLQLAQALATLHAAGKVHCDIKPSNVLVTKEGRVVVLDFGLMFGTEAGRTIDGSILGTPLYMSPEQCIGARLTPASDMYSVGAMLYEALTGRPPHEGKLVQVLAGKQHRDAVPPGEVADSVPVDLAALALALLHREPNRRPTAVAVISELARGGAEVLPPLVLEPSRSVFVGRDAELRELRDAFDRTLHGTPCTVHLRGGSGLGKTTLVQQLLGTLDADVLRGRCYERETVPYKAWDALIDDLTRHLRRLPAADARAILPDDVGSLARVFPVLDRVEAVRRSPERPLADLDPEAIRRRAVSALSELFGRMAARRPLVVFIDDLQWGDRDSARLLLELFALPDPPPILLLLAYRDEDAARSACLRELLDIRHREARPGAVRFVDVGPLDAESARRLARMLVDDGRNDADDVAIRIARESLGSPLFALELVRALASDTEEGLAGLSLASLILRRVTALDEPTRWLLKTIAVAGGPVPQGAVTAASGISGDGWQNLDRLRRARLVRSSGPGPLDVVEPFHDRIRETLVASLAPSARRERHEALARALVAADCADRELVARHWLAAGRVSEAAAELLRAAELAERSLAFDHAADLFGSVLEADVLDAGRRQATQRRHADALAHAGRAEQAARAYEICVEFAQGTEALELRGRAAEQLLRAGRFEEGLEAQRRLFADVGIDAPTSDAGALASMAWYSARLLASRFALRRTPAKLDARARIALDVFASNVPATNLSPLRTAALMSQWVSRALASGDPAIASRALAPYHGTIVAFPGGTVLGRMARTTLEPMLPELSDPMVQHHHSASLGMREFFGNAFDRAVPHFERAAAIARAMGPGARYELAAVESLLGWARIALGDLRVGFDEARDAYAAILRSGDRHGEMLVAPLASLSALAADDSERARAMLDVVAPRAGRREGYYEFVGRLGTSRVDRYLGGAGAFVRMEGAWGALASSPIFAMPLVASLARFERAQCALSAVDADADVDAALEVAQAEARALARAEGPTSACYAALVSAALAYRHEADGEAVALLLDAERHAQSGQLEALLQYARYRRGRLVGGSEGARLVGSAEGYLLGQGIVDAKVWFGMQVAGFGR